ncbi:MAG: outer membrane protein assembly factor BamA [Saprospiraceae bacterium]|jgi:outer membrane protein assembly factor BamA
MIDINSNIDKNLQSESLNLSVITVHAVIRSLQRLNFKEATPQKIKNSFVKMTISGYIFGSIQKLKIVSFAIISLLISTNISAQDSLRLTITSIDKTENSLIETIEYKTNFSQIVRLQKQLNEIVTTLQSKAFLTASIDSISRKKNHFEVFLFIGEQYKWAKLKNGNIDELFLAKVGFREKLYQNKPFDYSEVVKLKKALLDYCENNGYPFASVRLSNITIKKDKISASIFLNKGPLILINSIELVEPIPNISVGYLENYLGIKKGDFYDESKIKAIRKRLQELAFIKERRNLQVLFIGNSAKIYLFLDKKKASQFDFLIGFLPQNEETGRLTLTGNVQLYFQNLLGRGELIDLKWQQLRQQSPQLDIRLTYPYIANLPLGIDADFHLYKRDTTYLDINYNLGVQYLLDGGNYVKVFLDNFQTTLLTINEPQIINTKELPRTLDVNNSIIGLEWQQQRLDYRFNPRKGLSLKLRGGAGLKQIEISSLISNLEDKNNPTFDFSTLYDGFQTRSVQFRLQANVAYFIPFGSRGTVKVEVQSGSIFTQDSVYQNELYRIGGNQILRGFDEESIFASLYAITTVEGRLLTGQNAYLFAFFDYGYLQNQSIGRNISDFPFGFGLGMTLQVGTGVLTFSVATGRQLGNTINFQATKIHIGFVSFF